MLVLNSEVPDKKRDTAHRIIIVSGHALYANENPTIQTGCSASYKEALYRASYY